MTEAIDTDFPMTCAGAGEPAILFAHGFTCDRSDWAAQMKALAPRYRVAALDLPGHGAAALPERGDAAHLARALCAAKERLGARHTVLVGHSMGCRIVLEAYGRCPERIAGLVLADGGIARGADPAAARTSLAAALDEAPVAEIFAPLWEKMLTERCDPAIRGRAMRRLATIDPEFAKQVVLNIARWDRGDAARLLERIDVPVLMIQSTLLDDDFTLHRLEPGMTTPWTELVAHHVPGSQLRIISGTSHFLQIEEADAFTEHLAAFVASLGCA